MTGRQCPGARRRIVILIAALLISAALVTQVELGAPRVAVPPVLGVSVRYDGGFAETVERYVTRPIEDAVSEVPKMTSLRSVTSRNKTELTLQFRPGVDLDDAYLDLRAALQRVSPTLPQAAHPPQIRRADRDSRVAVIVALEASTAAAREIDARIENLRGLFLQDPDVVEVAVAGPPLREAHLVLIPERMSRAGISAVELARGVQRRFIIGGFTGAHRPIGVLDTRIRTLPDLEEAYLKPLTPVRELAEVGYARREPEHRGRLDGAERTLFYLEVRPDSDPVALSRRARHIAIAAGARIVFDRGEAIRAHLSNAAVRSLAGWVIGAAVFALLTGFRTAGGSQAADGSQAGRGSRNVGGFRPGGRSHPCSYPRPYPRPHPCSYPRGVLCGRAIAAGLRTVSTPLVSSIFAAAALGALGVELELGGMLGVTLAGWVALIVAGLRHMRPERVRVTAARIATFGCALLAPAAFLSPQTTYVLAPAIITSAAGLTGGLLVLLLRDAEEHPAGARRRAAEPKALASTLAHRRPGARREGRPEVSPVSRSKQVMVIAALLIACGATLVPLLSSAAVRTGVMTGTRPGRLSAPGARERDLTVTAILEFPAGTTLDTVQRRAAPFEHALLQQRAVVSAASRYEHERARFDLSLATARDSEPVAATLRRAAQDIPEAYLALYPDDRRAAQAAVALSGGSHYELRAGAYAFAERLGGEPWTQEVIFGFKQPPRSVVIELDAERTAHHGVSARFVAENLAFSLGQRVIAKWYPEDGERDVRVFARRQPAEPVSSASRHGLPRFGPDELLDLPAVTGSGPATRLGELGSTRGAVELDRLYRFERQPGIELRVLFADVGDSSPLEQLKALAAESSSQSGLRVSVGVPADGAPFPPASAPRRASWMIPALFVILPGLALTARERSL